MQNIVLPALRFDNIGIYGAKCIDDIEITDVEKFSDALYRRTLRGNGSSIVKFVEGSSDISKIQICDVYFTTESALDTLRIDTPKPLRIKLSQDASLATPGTLSVSAKNSKLSSDDISVNTVANLQEPGKDAILNVNVTIKDASETSGTLYIVYKRLSHYAQNPEGDYWCNTVDEVFSHISEPEHVSTNARSYVVRIGGKSYTVPGTITRIENGNVMYCPTLNDVPLTHENLWS